MPKPTVGQLSSQSAVHRALAEFDSLGREEFLRRNGFGKAKAWYLLKDGKHYDSKAIVGVALRYEYGTGLRSADYRGGVGSVVPKLRDLGFVVVSTEVSEETVRLAQEIDGAYAEGLVQPILVNRVERSAKARAACIEAHGDACAACGMRFAGIYGPEFDGLIHVHHIVPLSSVSDERMVSPKMDLRPVCPNCHAAIHFGGKTRSIESIAEAYRRHRRAAG